MNTSAKIGGLLAAVMLAASGSAMAAEPVNPYVTSSDGKVVMDPFGLCSGPCRCCSDQGEGDPLR